MRCVAIIQARLDSRRLPGKVLLDLQGHPMLWHVVQRVRSASSIDEVVVATSREPGDEPIRALCQARGIPCFSGSKADVLDRFYRAACEARADEVVRVTGDCPLVDPELIGRVIEFFRAGSYDHFGLATGAGASRLRDRRFPDGLDVECLSLRALSDAWAHAVAAPDREHVTPFIWRDPGRFEIGILEPPVDYSHLRWVVDHPEDFRVVAAIYQALHREEAPFLMEDVLGFLDQRPEVAQWNRRWIGRERYQSVWDPEEKQEPGEP